MARLREPALIASAAAATPGLHIGARNTLNPPAFGVSVVAIGRVAVGIRSDECPAPCPGFCGLDVAVADPAADVGLAVCHTLNLGKLPVDRMSAGRAIDTIVAMGWVTAEKLQSGLFGFVTPFSFDTVGAQRLCRYQGKNLALMESVTSVTAQRQMQAIHDAGGDREAFRSGSLDPVMMNIASVNRQRKVVDGQRVSRFDIRIHDKVLLQY